MTSFRSQLALSSLVALLAFTATSAQAQETEAELVTPAHTAEAFRAKARIYVGKAAAYRSEAEKHKEVARRFREEVDPKGRPANSRKDIQEMDKHCKAMSEHALALAKDADTIANFYERHAKALEVDAGAEAPKP